MKSVLLLILLYISLQTALAYQEKIIEKNNQWGGETTQTEFKENEQPPDIVIYAEVNNFSQLGINKIVEYYDLDGVLRKAVVFYKPTSQVKTEFKQVTDFFDQNGDHIKSEYIFNSKYAGKKGFFKKIAFFKKSGFNQEVVFYTPEQTKIQGYYKSILYKDFTGDVIKIERFNKQNQMLPEMPQ